MSEQVDKILDIYKRLCQIPTLVSARIISATKNRITVQSVWSQKNLERLTKQKFIQNFNYDADLQPLEENFPIEITSELMTCFSDDEKLKAILREVILDAKPKQFIEIWDKKHLIKSYDLSEYDTHGDVYTESTFSSFRLSHDNLYLLYVAEKKSPKYESYYQQKLKTKIDKLDNEEEVNRGMKYIYRPDWGEQLVGKHRSVVVILNIQDDTITPVSSIPDDYFPAQVIWTPDGNDIVGIAYKLKTRYLGLYACTNRESYIFHLKGNQFRKLTNEGSSCITPRFSPNGKYLIWLEREISPAHHHVHKLMCLKWNSIENPYIVVDLVKTYIDIVNDKKFYGLYNQSFPERCWSNDSKYLFFSTPQKFNIKSYIINIESKAINEVDSTDGSSLTVTDVKKDVVIFTKSSLINPPQLIIAKFNISLLDIGKLYFIDVTNLFSIPNTENLMYEHSEMIYKNDEPINNFNFTYFGTKNALNQSVPLIVALHGGPHSSYCNTFDINYALMVSLGFGILQINYRGSTGSGGDNINYLLGKVGFIDVIDCINAIDLSIEKYPWINPKKINLYGGSHGGFLSAHLSAQYPEKFISVVMLNPVIDLAAMFATTDIPDWCCAESGFCIFTNSSEVGENYNELFIKMLKHSPIIHVDKVKAPTLIALGSKDLRVPSSQGKLWYNRLLENDIITKLYIYDDNHSLRKNEVEVDNIINTAVWFTNYNEK